MFPRLSKIKFHYQVSQHFCHSLQFPGSMPKSSWNARTLKKLVMNEMVFLSLFQEKKPSSKYSNYLFRFCFLLGLNGSCFITNIEIIWGGEKLRLHAEDLDVGRLWICTTTSCQNCIIIYLVFLSTTDIQSCALHTCRFHSLSIFIPGCAGLIVSGLF